MKHFNLAVCLAALLSVFSLSSCLDGDGNSTGFNAEFVKVSGGMGAYSFINPGGYQIIPTNQQVITRPVNTPYAFIQYTYDMAGVQSGSKTVDVDLVDKVLPIASKMMVPVTGEEEMKEFANAPISFLSTNSTDAFSVQFFWNPTTMFLPIYYFVKKGTETERDAELNSHDFVLFYDVNDKDAKENHLLLHLRHRVDNDGINSERDMLNYTIFHFDLQRAVTEYEMHNAGAKPQFIEIEYESNASNGEYDKVSSSSIEINYSEVLGLFER